MSIAIATRITYFTCGKARKLEERSNLLQKLMNQYMRTGPQKTNSASCCVVERGWGGKSGASGGGVPNVPSACLPLLFSSTIVCHPVYLSDMHNASRF
jgi:hypothetical protein